MNNSGTISVWIGQVKSESVMKKALDYTLTEDGDMIACAFCKGVGIDVYEPEKLEWKYFSKTMTKAKLMLNRFSYSQEIIQEFERLGLTPSGNCCIAMYDLNITENLTSFDITDMSLEFICNLEY